MVMKSSNICAWLAFATSVPHKLKGKYKRPGSHHAAQIFDVCHILNPFGKNEVLQDVMAVLPFPYLCLKKYDSSNQKK